MSFPKDLTYFLVLHRLPKAQLNLNTNKSLILWIEKNKIHT